MPNYNKIILIGHLCQPTETKTTANGTVVLNNTIAVNEKQKGKEDKANFIEFTAFGKAAEAIGKYLNKGNPLLIEGRLDQQRWETDSGEKRSKLKVIVERFTFVGGGSGNKSPKAHNEDDYEPVNDDDIPF